jgi:CRISPR-associated protein Cmr3
MTVPERIALLPRDGFFCKDGRGWHTSTSGRGHALDWPWPSTILGALRTASGREKEGRCGRTLTAAEWQAHAKDVSLHRLLALRRPVGAEWDIAHRVWPVPQDALWLEEARRDEDSAARGTSRIEFLGPKPRSSSVATLGREVDIASDEAREALWWPTVGDAAKPLPRPRWWSEDEFVAWVADPKGKPAPETPDWGRAPLRRVQVHVGIDEETFTAAESVLFSHDVIETQDRHDPCERAAEWAIGAEVKVPDGFGAGLVRLGSDSRLAYVEKLPENVFKPPPNLLNAFDNGGKGRRGLRLIVVTPVKFEQGWLPSGFKVQDSEFRGQVRNLLGELCLRAAYVPRPLHVSGWNMVGGGSSKNRIRNGTKLPKGGAPKETSRLVPPGAVYFFERVDGSPFGRDDADKLWLSAHGARTDEGFGRVVPGIWDP